MRLSSQLEQQAQRPCPARRVRRVHDPEQGAGRPDDHSVDQVRRHGAESLLHTDVEKEFQEALHGAEQPAGTGCVPSSSR